MDFAQNYRIGIDWGHNGVSYLRHQGRKLVLAWPSSLILDSETSHVTDANVALVTDGLGIRLKTPTLVMIPPHSLLSEFYTAKMSITSCWKSLEIHSQA